jgi:hypothetical protein
LYYPIAINITQKYRGYLRIFFGHSGVIDTAEAKVGDFKVEYLREFHAICKKALTRGSGVLEKLFDEKKTRGRKSPDTVPFTPPPPRRPPEHRVYYNKSFET